MFLASFGILATFLKKKKASVTNIKAVFPQKISQSHHSMQVKN
jgi:hypothetical protein